MDSKTGKVTATGVAKTDADKKLQDATTDKKVNVIVETINDSQTVGVFDGNEIKDGIVNTFQYVNTENTAKVDEFAERPSGNTILHETLESYIGGLFPWSVAHPPVVMCPTDHHKRKNKQGE
jgi:hypothetical protein